MSYYFKTIPKNIVLMLRDSYSLDAFVETGTYMGLTTEWAASHFKEVHTIEILPQYYSIAELRLLNFSTVTMWLNDSRDILPRLLMYLGSRKVLFYLDAHWSEGAQYGRPLIDSTAVEEVEIINQWNDSRHVIIVDDAHRFGTDRWPTKADIIGALENNGKRHVRELLDVLIATPVPKITIRR